MEKGRKGKEFRVPGLLSDQGKTVKWLGQNPKFSRGAYRRPTNSKPFTFHIFSLFFEGEGEPAAGGNFWDFDVWNPGIQ